MVKDFRKELEKLVSKHEDSILAKYINECLKAYDLNNFINKPPTGEELFGVDLQKLPEKEKNLPAQTINKNQPIPAPIGNNTSSGWRNPFGGTSWGM